MRPKIPPLDELSSLIYGGLCTRSRYGLAQLVRTQSAAISAAVGHNPAIACHLACHAHGDETDLKAAIGLLEDSSTDTSLRGFCLTDHLGYRPDAIDIYVGRHLSSLVEELAFSKDQKNRPLFESIMESLSERVTPEVLDKRLEILRVGSKDGEYYSELGINGWKEIQLAVKEGRLIRGHVNKKPAFGITQEGKCIKRIYEEYYNRFCPLSAKLDLTVLRSGVIALGTTIRHLINYFGNTGAYNPADLEYQNEIVVPSIELGLGKQAFGGLLVTMESIPRKDIDLSEGNR